MHGIEFPRFRILSGVTKAAVRPDGVVFLPPVLNQYLCFFQRVEDLSIE